MGYFKKFTDFGAALAAANGAVYLIRTFMAFRPGDIESKSEKLKLFLSKEAPLDYRSFLLLCLFLLLSALMGRIFRKLPLVSLPFALYSFYLVMYFFDCSKLYDRPMLFVILSALHVLGNLAELLMRDREDGKHRAPWAAHMVTLTVPVFCLYVLERVKKVPDIPVEEISYFDSQISVSLFLKHSFEPLQTLIWLCAGCVLISLLLWNLYYVDAILSVIPLCYTVYLWETEALEVFPEILVALLTMNLIFRIAIMLAERPKHIKNKDFRQSENPIK